MKNLSDSAMQQIQGGSWLATARVGMALYGADMAGACMTAVLVSGFGAILAGGAVAIIGTTLGWGDDDTKDL